METSISTIYIHSLIRLLHLKSSVRQRRVMLDLIYVNILNVAFDLITVILVYLNLVGLSHPIQTFSYIFKLRLEFIVLNQLMSVAARGLKRETFEDKRYHMSAQADTFSNELRHFGFQDSTLSEQKTEASTAEPKIEAKKIPSRDDPSKSSLQISMPSRALSRGHHPSMSANSEQTLPNSENERPWPLEDDLSKEVSQDLPESPIIPPEDIRPSRRRIKAALHSVRPRSQRHKDSGEPRPPSAHGGKIGQRRSMQRPWDDDDEEEIGLHMWEQKGRVILEVPWFRTAVQDV